MLSTSSLPSFLGLLWPRVVAPDRVLFMGQIEQFDLKTNDFYLIELLEIELFDHLTVYLQIIYLIYM